MSQHDQAAHDEQLRITISEGTHIVFERDCAYAYVGAGNSAGDTVTGVLGTMSTDELVTALGSLITSLASVTESRGMDGRLLLLHIMRLCYRLLSDSDTYNLVIAEVKRQSEALRPEEIEKMLREAESIMGSERES